VEKIILEIDEMGNVHGEVQGVKGPICTKVRDWLSNILGTRVKSTPKKEYHQHEMVEIKR
jgi:hypothetical protein